MKSALVALSLLFGFSTVGHAQESAPLVLLLDGLGVYVESNYIGVSALARPLQQQGFRTQVDSHLMTKTAGLVPDIIIGHSMGGDTAIRYSRQMVRAGAPAPYVITIDAAPAPPACVVPRCINIHGPGFVNVRGATNIDAWASGARFAGHPQLPTHPVVKAMILNRTAAYMAERKAAAVKVAAKTTDAETTDAKPATGKPADVKTADGKATASATSAPRAATAAPAAPPKMWSLPRWTIPGLTPNGG